MNNKLSNGQKIGFGICDLGGNALFTIISIYLMNYFTDVVGLSPALAGTAILIGKIWDAFINPLIGLASDRTKSRWGRRKPYIFIGAIGIFFTMILIFTKPEIHNNALLFVWALAAFCSLCLAFSIVAIPYSSLTPELTDDYNEKTSLNGFRMIFANIGTLLGAIVFYGIVLKAPDKKTGYITASIIFGLIIMLVSFITVFSVKENKKELPKVTTNIFNTTVQAFRNIPFLIVLLTWFFHMIGIGLITGIQIYYFKYILNAEPMSLISLIILFGSSLIFIPIWVIISKKLGKNICYSIGLIIAGISVLFLFLFAQKSIPITFFFIGLSSIGISSTFVNPWAIIPDTVEYDFVKSKERREGIYYGIWNFCFITGQAIAAMITGLTLDMFKYIPNQLEQSASSIFGIRLLMGPMPAFFLFIGAAIILFYPITKEKYEEIILKVKENSK